MSQISGYFDQAELSLAAYANLVTGEPNQTELIRAGMSVSQAAAFAATYTVVDQYTDPASGFSATVFERAGQRYMAIRGTQPADVLDLIADADLALSGAAAKQIVSLFNYVQRLNGAKGQPVAQLEWNGQDYVLNQTDAVGLLDAPLSGLLSITGHSLGGHLAMAVGRLFPQMASQIYTYNAPGFVNAGADNLFARIDAALGRTGSTFPDAVTTNLYGSGLNVIAGYANDHGTPQEVFLEGNTHSVVAITDSLAVYNLLSSIDPALTLDSITNILQASSNVVDYSLESTVAALGKVFMVASASSCDATSIFNIERDKLYIATHDILNTVQSCYTIVPLETMDAATLAANAKGDIAYRYALVNSLPFAVVGADYSTLNTSGDYDLYDPATGRGALSDKYLEDRSAYLVAKLNDNRTDGTINTLQDVRYRDLANNITLDPVNTEVRRVTFGSASDEGFSGGSGDDHLYGGAGNDDISGGGGKDYLEGGQGIDTLNGGTEDDTLVGGAGDDILAGGSGNDTYIYRTGEGADTITDTDGSIQYDGTTLNGGIGQKGSGIYTSADGTYTYAWTGGDLVINGTITVTNFRNNDLGIHLDQREDPSDPPKPPVYNPGNAAFGYALSPLALDLNNNGRIDDIALANSPVYFDLTQDGIAEKAGWITPEDGLLALDRNGNGVVDDRGELFGTQPGYTALGWLGYTVDTNQDGVVNADDPLFSALRVWQDANSDGISQAGELKTLDELGITSISTVGSQVSQPTANGNNIISIGSYTRNAQQQYMADIEFAYNPALTDANPNRSLGTTPQLDADVYQLPWLRGYGLVKSLQLAYQEDTSLRQAANDLIAQGRDGILQNFESFMAKWTGLEAAHQAMSVTRTNLTIEDKVWMLETLTGQYVYKGDIEGVGFGWMRPWGRAGWDSTYIEGQWQRFVQKEASTFAIQATAQDWIKGAYYSLSQDCFVVTDAQLLQDTLQETLLGINNDADAKFATAVLTRLKADGVELSPETLKQGLSQSAYAPLFYNALDFNGEFIFGGGQYDWLRGGTGNDIIDGGAGNDYLLGGAGSDTYVFGRGYGHDEVTDWQVNSGEIDTILMKSGIQPSDVEVTRDSSHLYLSLHNADGTVDVLKLNNWNVYNDLKAKQVLFENGTVWNAAELAVLANTPNNGDNLIEGTAGDDVIDGQGGNDTLVGGAGNDTYVFGRGAGKDTVVEFDPAAGNTDTVQVAAGVLPSDVSVSRDYWNLYLSIANTDGSTDRLTIQDWFRGDACKIEQVLFADSPNTVWDVATLTTMANVPTEGSDIIDGTAFSDAIYGLDGNDHIWGQAGNDFLDGGAGNDFLDGGEGDDTYFFGRGSGQDYVTDYDTTLGNLDTVQIASDILPSDVLVSRDQWNLYLNITNPDGTTDRLTLSGWYSGGDACKVEQVVFVDGTVWDVAMLNTLANTPTEGADYIQSTSGNDVINGLGGNDQIFGMDGNDALSGGEGSDTLVGGAGNDTLDGGAGNDVLCGGRSDWWNGEYLGNGNDTYVFGRGSGQDTVIDHDTTIGNIDTVMLAPDVSPEDVAISRNGSDLCVSINGTSDKLTIQNWYTTWLGTTCRIEQLVFSDGTAWGMDELTALAEISFATPGLLQGAVGDDVITGTDGNDTILGNAGNDTLNGGVGSDSVLGGGGNDILDGGAGNDKLLGGSGNDTYLFASGAGQDTVIDFDTTAGNLDTVRAVGVLPAAVSITRDVSNLYLSINNADGTSDKLTLQNWFISDAYRVEQVIFDDGTVWDAAKLGSTPILGTGGNDLVSGNIGSDVINGLAGDDTLVGGDGNDILDGGSENDILYGGSSDWGWDYASSNGNDTYLFGRGSGQDTVIDYDRTVGNVDTIQVAADVLPADVVLSRDQSNLYLTINGTADKLTLQNWFGENAFRIEQVVFSDGTVWDTTVLCSTPLLGSEGNDVITSYSNSDDVIEGLGGNDSLSGGAGNDTLDGGTGNDVLYGGYSWDSSSSGTSNGNDTYIFGIGSGQDTVFDYDTAVGNVDKVQIASGVLPGDVTISRDQYNLYISINGTTDRLALQNWFRGDAYKVEQVVFASDPTSVWDVAMLNLKANPAPTEDDDILYGNGSDIVNGLGGNDTLIGSDWNDTLDGGVGNDTLNGGAGNDTYVFGRGSGQDTVIDFYTYTAGNVDKIQIAPGVSPNDVRVTRDHNNLYLSINGTTDRLTLQNWFAVAPGYDFKVEQVVFADDTNTVWDAAALNAMVDAPTEGADMLFGTGGDNVINGMGGNDTMFGLEGNDVLDGGAGNDILQGGTGNDTYVFNLGGGQDTIYEYDTSVGNIDTIRFGVDIAPSDIIFGVNGNDLILLIDGTTDRITVQNGKNRGACDIECVVFSDGTVWGAAYIQAQVAVARIMGTSGKDYLYGDAADNTLDGSAGNDYLIGGVGSDTYLFNLGDGQDKIFEADTTVGNLDTIRFGVGITASDIGFGRNGNDLVLSINGTTDQLIISNWGDGEAYRIERVVFADGAVWGAADLPSQLSGLPVMGTTENDYLYGGEGNTTYLFNLGGGQDTIDDYDSAAGNVDTIRFGAGIAASDITFARSGLGLVLGINGTNDQVTIQNWGYEDPYHIERVEFADGTVWDAAQIQSLIPAVGDITGTDGNDILSAWAGENAILQGLSGNDTLLGNDGNDTLDGGAGNDHLQGLVGNDTYLFNLGSGQDTIYDYDPAGVNVDTIRFGAGIAASDITFTRSGMDLVLGINGTSDQLTICNWGYGDAYHVEQIEFADGVVWTAAYLQAQISGLPIVGTTANDYLYGDSGNNTLGGGVGNDYLEGNAGNDAYLFNLGDGQDTIFDYDPTTGNVDTIRFGAGITESDIVFTRSGMNLVLSINGTTDQLTIQCWGWGNPYRIERMEFADGTVRDAAYLQTQALSAPIVGTTGNDILYGDAGNNTLDGGAGNDTLQGGAGNDTYLFNLGDGQDTIYENGGIDTVRFGAGITASDITFARNGMDLVLGINGTNDQLKIQNWGYGNDYRIERVEFADGTVWDATQVQSQVPVVTNITGTDINDTLYAWVGEDTTLQGMGGDDILIGSTGNDTLDGGVGSDLLQGGGGADTYLFGRDSGQDTINAFHYGGGYGGGYGGDYGGSGTIRFGAGIAESDIAFTRSGMDLVLGINGTTDQVTIQNWAYGNDHRIGCVEFADGTVWDAAQFQALISAAPVAGAEGSDVLRSWPGENATLQGLGGDDYLYGNNGNDILDGGAGNDYLEGGAGNDTYLFNLGDGRDTISEYDSTAGNVDTIRFGVGIAASDITITRSGADLVLSVNGTTDQVTIHNWGNGDPYHIERVEFADGTVWDAAQFQALVSAASVVVVGTEGSDVLQGWSGENATLQGLGGDDYLYGNDGNDILGGGAGNDYLEGGAGNDTYLCNLGAGQDTIYEGGSTAGNVDTIRFGAGIAASDITITRIGYDLVLGINGTADQVTIQNWGNGDPYHIERVEFADGTVWDAVQLKALLSAIPIMGTEGVDNLQSWVGENANLQGIGGDDYLYGNDGNDILDGGAGNDYLEGGAGNDTYLFNLGDGQDTIYEYDSAAGNVDTIRFGAGIAVSDIAITRIGNDLVLGINGTADQVTIQNWAYGNDYHIEQVEFADGTVWDAAQFQARVSAAPMVVVGTEGSDVLQCGTGENATLQGMGGDDYLFGSNGNDILIGGTGNDYLTGGSGNDTYVFNLGDGQDTISEYDPTAGNIDTIRFGAGIAASDITFTRSGLDLVLSIAGTTDQVTIQSWGYDASSRIEQVEFADGTVWDAPYLQTNIQLPEVLGTGGDDELILWAGESGTLQGLDGNDYLVAIDGSNTLDGGTGDDYLVAVHGNNTLLGGEGDDQLAVGDGNNTLDGGVGNDYLQGSTGNDTYLFNLGDGQDVIYDWSDTAGSVDTIRFGAGIAASDITFSRSGYDLVLGVNGTTDQVTIQDWGCETASRIERVEFADGAVWDSAQLQTFVSASPAIGTEGVDYLQAWAGESAVLQGLGGDDELYGTDGNDILDGGAGNDYLEGGAGNDTYLFNLGDGQDTIYECDYTSNNVDTIRFGAGVAASDIAITSSGMDLVLGINGTTDQVTIQGWGYDWSSRIERVEFADGTVWDAAYVQSQTLTTDIIGSDGGDYLCGDGWNNNITGGAGNDYLVGGSGNDTYLFGRGFGQDVLYEEDYFAGNIDQVIFASDILPSDVLVSSTIAGDLVLSVSGTSDTLTLSSWLTADTYKVEKVGFADGTVWGVDDLTNMVISAPTEADDIIVGTSGSDTLDALGGNDAMFGGAGDDVLIAGSGDDVLYGGGGVDRLYGGDGIDSLYADSPYKNTGNDLLDGGAGDDYIESSVANDLILGGAGTDYVYDEDGKDVLLFNRGDGQDTYELYTQNITSPAQRTISLGGGVSYSDLAFSTDGTNLVLELGNGDSVTFSWWFDAPESKTIRTLQVITETMPGYDPNSTDPLFNKRVQQFDFARLANQFEAAFAADPTIISWQLVPHLSDCYFGGSDTQALGGAMAYQYGKFGTLSGLSDAEIGSQLNDASFGVNGQSIQINSAPVVSDTLSDQTGTQGQIFEFTVPAGAFTDIDQGDALTYSATLADGTALPTWLVFDAATQTFSGTPGNLDVGNYSVTVIATDGSGLSASSTFAVDVANVNDAPTVSMAPADQTVQQDAAFSFTVPAGTFDDVDFIHGDSLTYAVTLADGNALPAWLTFDAATQTFSGIPANGDVGNINVRVTATDFAGASVSTTFALDVQNVNDAPVVASPIAAQQTSEDTPFSFALPAGTFTDVDQGDALTYSATMADGSALPSWLVFDAATQTFSGTPANGDVGSYSVVVTATDLGGLSASSTFAIGVANVNDAPVVSAALVAQSITQGQAFSYALPADSFTDVDVVNGDVLTYTATLADGTALPAWLNFDVATLTFSGTPGGGDVANLNVVVTATDTGGLSANSSFALAVNTPVFNGTTGDDVLTGTTYDDRLNGLAGNDILQGGDGSDTLADTAGANLLDGGAGTDTLTGNSGNEMFVGGIGNDTINTGTGADIIAFNAGDGADVVNGGIGTDNTITLGGGVNYADLALSKVNNDLILEVGGGDQITLANWYDSTANYKSVIDLQVMADAMATFDPASGDPLLNQAVQNFDFTAIVNAFDQANGGSATYMHWSATNSLLAAHLSGSDTTALGGDLAHQFGTGGSLTGMNLTAAQTALNDPQFGGAAQTLHPLQGLQGGAVTL